ncbi:DUF739 family protein [Carnobacterium maltaromaticum]|uniref:DUF739 family protein n=1 Tax=Carnobacterium maltaromaticum TaxID=2751 RepID=UPI00214CBD07|nr:DUF739 family protein [Carnobacterium maltaromaticum]
MSTYKQYTIKNTVYFISIYPNDKVSWKDDEILKAAKLLNVAIDDIPRYFFKEKVHEK